ncbi:MULTISPECIES: hypothetical protein [unclassified Nocardiopsis]|uniref:hypothetical protein n=1 Tax=unclassified Nocardiopsis TaxID=2649073 RepID=UPI003411911C
MEPEKQDVVLRETGRAVVDRLPHGWHEIVVDFHACHRVSVSTVVVTGGDGAVTYPDLPGSAVSSLRELREGMYREGTGTWFGLRYVITHDRRFHVDYAYDAEPDFGFELALGDYWRDAERFPRNPERVPEWLREKLRRYEAGEA